MLPGRVLAAEVAGPVEDEAGEGAALGDGCGCGGVQVLERQGGESGPEREGGEVAGFDVAGGGGLSPGAGARRVGGYEAAVDCR